MTTLLGRLTERSEFLRVAASRRKSVAPGLILQALRRDGGSEQRSRIGFTASKKVGNAVIRNRARRPLRAPVRQVMPLRSEEHPSDLHSPPPLACHPLLRKNNHAP